MPYSIRNRNKLVSAAVYVFFFLLSPLILLLIFSSKATAQGNLLIMPKRVVLEGSKRSEELNLANTGKDTATYVISFIQIRMKEDGKVEQISQPDSAQLFADKYVRFFPRTVTLGPNESQTVKVQITRSNELQPGEYRSHLYFRAVPKEGPLGEKEPEKDSSSISVHLVPIFGISLPVIIRVGESTTRVNFSDVSLNKDTIPVLQFTFNRSGNMSVYGDVTVDHISLKGKVSHVGAAKGVAVYTPYSLRHFRLLLDKNAGVDYHSGKLHLVYSDQSAKSVILAEEDIVL